VEILFYQRDGLIWDESHISVLLMNFLGLAETDNHKEKVVSKLCELASSGLIIKYLSSISASFCWIIDQQIKEKTVNMSSMEIVNGLSSRRVRCFLRRLAEALPPESTHYYL
jgi:hypothetical protein